MNRARSVDASIHGALLAQPPFYQISGGSIALAPGRFSRVCPTVPCAYIKGRNRRELNIESGVEKEGRRERTWKSEAWRRSAEPREGKVRHAA